MENIIDSSLCQGYENHVIQHQTKTPEPKGKRRRARKSEETRKRILDASAALFGEQGYFATTLRQIAKRAEIDAGSIYYYFASKDEILHEVMDIGIRAVFEAVRDSVEALPNSTTNRQRLEAATKAHLNTLLKFNAYTSANIAIFAQVSREAQNRNRKLRQDYAAYWHDLFDAAQRSGEISPDADLSLARLSLLGTLNWSMQWYDPKRKSIDELAASFCAMLFDGIAESNPATPETE